MPDGAVLMDPAALEDGDDAEWRTGTVIDLYNGIYRILCVDTKRRGAMTPADVDRLDLSTVAVMLGVAADPGAADRAELAEIGRQRAAGEAATWAVDDWPDMDAMRRPT